jgi:hypothetical protein
MIKSELTKTSKDLYRMLESKAMAGKIANAAQSGDLSEIFGEGNSQFEMDKQVRKNSVSQSRFALGIAIILVVITVFNLAIMTPHFGLATASLSALVMSGILYIGVAFMYFAARIGMGIINRPMKWAVGITIVTLTVTIVGIVLGIFAP